MFEEVPRSRRGLAAYLGVTRLTARRIVLGPFVIGGGMVLAAVGGSVAVAATVLTASTIRASDVPHVHPVPVVVTSSAAPSRPVHHSSTPAKAAVAVTARPTSPGPVLPPPLSASPSAAPSRPVVSATLTGRTSAGSSQTSSSAPSSGSPAAGSPSSSPSPAGNALVYVSGWDAAHRRLVFEFAAVSVGTGPQRSDVYSVASPRQFTATLAGDLHVVSGGQLCPPAGSSCTVDQLIAGSARGFYAEVAIDPDSAVHSVLERDNVVAFGPAQPTASPPSTEAAPSASPQPSAQPTA